MKMQNSKIIFQTAQDLMRKNLMPKHTLSYLKDPNMLKAAITEFNNSQFKSWRCPECGITMNAPKSWLIQHVKIHHMTKERKENEIRDTRINPYRNVNRVNI